MIGVMICAGLMLSLVALDAAAWRWGAESRDRRYRLRWSRFDGQSRQLDK